MWFFFDIIFLSAIFSRFLIYCSNKYQFFQPVSESVSGIRKKEFVPSLGGVVVLIIVNIFFSYNLPVVLLMNYFGFIGLFDDLKKIFYQNSKGLSIKLRLFLEIVGSLFFVHYSFLQDPSRFSIPCFGNLGLINYFWGSLVIMGSANSLNLTDGVDALASTIAIYVLLFVGIKFNLSFPFILIFAILGFLIFNFPPAKLYMGDIGALSIGSAIGALYFQNKFEFALPFLGFILVAETLSSALQIFFIKKYNKKIFLMAPLHHHLEMKQWTVIKILTVFNLISLSLFIVGAFIWF